MRLTIDRHGMLQELEVSFEVVQEYAPSSSSIAAVAVTAAVAGGKGEVNMLGFVRLNLAEYVEVGNSNTGEGGEGEVVRRYLMQGSKINSTLKVCPTVSYPALPCLLSFYSLFICITVILTHTSQIGILMTQTEGETNFIAYSTPPLSRLLLANHRLPTIIALHYAPLLSSAA